MKRSTCVLVLLVVGTIGSGCATTLEHPLTHHTIICQSGYWVGGGTGIAGAVTGGVAVLSSLLMILPYRDCLTRAKDAGYVAQPPPRPSVTESEPSTSRSRE